MKRAPYLLLLCGLLVSALPAFGQASGEGPSLKRDLIEVLDSFQDLGTYFDISPEVQQKILETRDSIRAMPEEEWKSAPSYLGPGVEQLSDSVRKLRSLMAARAHTKPFPKTAGFPTASYPFVNQSSSLGTDSFSDDVDASQDESEYADGSYAGEDDSWSILCDTGVRSSSEVMFVAQNVFFTAKLIRDLVSRGCDQVFVVVVLGGGGGNCSLCCTIADVVFTVAEVIFNSINLCDALIDSAEIQGSYERLAHLHGDMELMQSSVDAESREAIESNLMLSAPDFAIASYQVPEAFGGNLGLVAMVVQGAMDNMTAAGQSINFAQTFFDQATDLAAAGSYKQAYLMYRRAYREVVKLP